MVAKFRPVVVTDRFADTRDTLCYATNDNQSATYGMLEQKADLAIVAGGYNSSNTTHLVELCEAKLPTYFIESEVKILTNSLIRHYKSHQKEEITTVDFLPHNQPSTIMLTCGASCPDVVVEGILNKILSFYPNTRNVNDVLADLQ
jgi:4-hydroxy-3-methylbut-2-enyl diphosphate reductase